MLSFLLELLGFLENGVEVGKEGHGWRWSSGWEDLWRTGMEDVNEDVSVGKRGSANFLLLVSKCQAPRSRSKPTTGQKALVTSWPYGGGFLSSQEQFHARNVYLQEDEFPDTHRLRLPLHLQGRRLSDTEVADTHCLQVAK